MKTLHAKRINNKKLLQTALTFPTTGYLLSSTKKLTYLDIDDAYIHQLSGLLKNKPVKKPYYFSEELIGAHISAIYPEENIIVAPEDLGQKHQFTVQGIFSAELDEKKYYILTIESYSLLQLRRKYGLSDKPCFRGYSVDFHITIGVSL